MHQFYEFRGMGWHRYPDGSIVKLPVREGYAMQWAKLYCMMGHKALAIHEIPEGETWF